MPLRVDKGPEPLSSAAIMVAPRLARSSAFEILSTELERYAKGEINGRSFLIAGHRGAGKSTLLAHVVDEVGRRTSGVRPILVALHGPSLLKGLAPEAKSERSKPAVEKPNAAEVEGVAPGARHDPAVSVEVPESGPVTLDAWLKRVTIKPAEDPAAGDEKGTIEHFLTQVTVALYRAVTKEVLARYEATAFSPTATAPMGAVSPSAEELVGQLAIELGDGPDARTLRGFWERIDALEWGVIDPTTAGRRRGQGAREIVAIATAAQAFRVISGRVESETGSKAEIERSRESTFELGPFRKEALTLGAGLAAGGAVVLAKPSLGEIVTALAVGFVTAAALRLTVTRKQTRSARQETTFVRSYEIANLDRELPNLVDRLREAGLVPVFVIDELDKVPAIDRVMEALIERLKLTMAERTFFCFLTDREYYETILHGMRSRRYSREHTFFSRLLFIFHTPAELRAYLEEIIQPVTPPLTTAERDDRQTLADLILRQSRLHMIDIQRVVDSTDFQRRLFELANRQPDATAQNPTREIALACNAAYQTAVELVLADPQTETWLLQDPYHGQLAKDALYHPGRCWDKGDPSYKIEKDVLRRHLEDRSGRGRGLARVDDPMLDRLTKLVERLMELLSATDLETRSLGTLKRRPSLPPAPLVASRPNGAFDWRYTVLGMDTRTLEAAVVDLQAAHDFVRKLNDLLDAPAFRGITPRKLDELGVFKSPPSWESFEQALRQLGSAGAVPTSPQGQVLRTYTAMLEHRGRLIGAFLAKAVRLGRAAGDRAASIYRGERAAEVLAGGFELRSRSEEELAELAARWSSETDLGELPTLAIATPDPWLAALSGAATATAALAEIGIEAERAKAFEDWNDRLRKLVAGEPSTIVPTDADLRCQIAAVTPATLLKPDLRQMTALEWGTVLRHALTERNIESPDFLPLWMAWPALSRLRLEMPARELAIFIQKQPADPARYERDRRRWDADEKLTLEWFDFMRDRTRGQPAQRNALALVGGKGSPAGDWPCPDRHGVLPVQAGAEGTLLEAFRKLLDDWRALPFDTLLLETSVTAPPPPGLLQGPDGTPGMKVFRFSPTRVPTPPTDFPLIVAPNYDEVLDSVGRLAVA